MLLKQGGSYIFLCKDPVAVDTFFLKKEIATTPYLPRWQTIDVALALQNEHVKYPVSLSQGFSKILGNFVFS